LTLRHALRRDLPTVVDIWVDAFTGDPFLGWMAGGTDTGWARFAPRWMQFIVDLTFERGHTYLDGDHAAVSWIPPDLAFAGPEDIARGRAIIADAAGEERAAAALETIVMARSHELEVSHWVLQYVGVRSAARGGGVGAAAVAPMLAVADRDGLLTALISSNPRNVSFYERVGFAVQAEVPSPDGAVTLRPMVRPAAG
jgi:GNAT superfamily N-acetyltransferase